MTEQDGQGEHVRRNRAAWDVTSRDYAEPGRRAWQEEPTWGIWSIPEAEVRLLPEVAGRDAIELGCCTASVST
ncbi:MAG: hypothetical protein ACR2PL_03650 [Dehalococcoidia bacterium]